MSHLTISQVPYGPLPQNSFDQITHFPDRLGQIFLGSRPRRERDDLHKMKDAKIKYVISLVEPREIKPGDYTSENYVQANIEYYSFPTPNHQTPASGLLIEIAQKVTKLMKNNDGNVLVHCNAGISRSAKAVFWILMFAECQPNDILKWMNVRPTSILRESGEQSRADCERLLASCKNTHKCVMYRCIE